ncbi:MAG: hypothetical protein JW748_02850 [Anaerolineales bacterium]|nr:hypothetical protein [Anaerolineales bacterium]
MALTIGCSPAAPQTSSPTLPNPATFTWPSIPTKSPADTVRSVSVDGLTRSYLLYIPIGLSAGSPAPLVLVFHGHRMNGDYMLVTTGFHSLAEANQFIVAYPNGTGPAEALSFNAGLCCGSAERNNIDEAAFVRAVLSDLEGIAVIDPKRIFVTGFSNGAMLAYRLACELSDTIAAVAPVAGNLGYGPCEPQGKVSVLHIQGLSDASAPYADDDLEPDLDPVIRSVQGSVAWWASHNGCAEFPYDSRDGIATHTVYSGCAGGTAVELYSLYGIGHIWPPDSLWPASRVIWEFFAAHPKTEIASDPSRPEGLSG